MKEPLDGQIKKFKERLSKLDDPADIDIACLDWLTLAAAEQYPRMRDVLQKNIDALRMGLS